MPGNEITKEDLDRLFDPNAPAGPEVHDHATCPCCGGQSPDLPYSQKTVPENRPLTDEERELIRRNLWPGTKE